MSNPVEKHFKEQNFIDKMAGRNLQGQVISSAKIEKTLKESGNFDEFCKSNPGVDPLLLEEYWDEYWYPSSAQPPEGENYEKN